MDQNYILDNTVLGSKWFNPDFLFSKSADIFHQSGDFFSNNGSGIISVYHTIAFILAIFFLSIISYCFIRILEIRSKEKKHLAHEIAEYAHHQAEREKKKQHGDEISKNERWVKTLGYLFSQHPGDWKLAVIEADSMLDALLTQLGFKGETLGDKLKGASQDKFPSLTSAWEVHTIRNRIAHEGATFALSQHEAKRVISLYEQIFRGFGYI